MAITNSSQVTVKFSPWEENGFGIKYIHVWESIGGRYPGGQMELHHSGNQDSLNFITSQQTGVVDILDEKDGGLNFSFGIFITNRDYFNNVLVIDFIIISKDDLERGQLFYTKPESETYNNIIDAVKSTWKGKIDPDNIDSDVPDSVKIYRCNETGAEFLTRLGYSWKYKSIFAFGWDGLIFRDISENIKSEIEVASGAGLWYQKESTPIKYDKMFNNDSFNPWTNENKDDESSISISATSDVDFSDLEPEYITSAITHQGYRLFAKGYDVMDKNYNHNSNFTGYSNISIVAQDMPKDWKLGDVVMYKRLDTAEGDAEPTKCVIAGNEMFFSQHDASQTGPNGYPFEWTCNLWGLEELAASKEIKNNDENQDE